MPKRLRAYAQYDYDYYAFYNGREDYPEEVVLLRAPRVAVGFPGRRSRSTFEGRDPWPEAEKRASLRKLRGRQLARQKRSPVEVQAPPPPPERPSPAAAPPVRPMRPLTETEHVVLTALVGVRKHRMPASADALCLSKATQLPYSTVRPVLESLEKIGAVERPNRALLKYRIRVPP